MQNFDSETEDKDQESSSEAEPIPEIIPTRKRRLKKKSEEILVDKSDRELEREMVTIDKSRQADAEAQQSDLEDQQPKLTEWSDSEDE